MEFYSKGELEKCLKDERLIYFPDGRRAFPFGVREKDVLWCYVKTLRMVEYHDCMKHRTQKILYEIRLKRMSNLYGIHIAPHCCDIGLSIAHVGSIVIHGNCKIGKNFRVHVGVNIGANGGEPPIIGDDVYVGPGAKIFGAIYLADGCRVGANAVVNKSCNVKNSILVGVPAYIVDKR